MGFETWQNRTAQCTDYSETYNEKDGYVKKDMVVTPVQVANSPDYYVWKVVYVK